MGRNDPIAAREPNLAEAPREIESLHELVQELERGIREVRVFLCGSQPEPAAPGRVATLGAGIPHVAGVVQGIFAGLGRVRSRACEAQDQLHRIRLALGSDDMNEVAEKMRAQAVPLDEWPERGS